VNYEEELYSAMVNRQKQKEERGDKATDEFIRKVLDAQYRYEYLSEILGPDSPAKQVAKEKDRAAKAEAAIQ
jgi:hypothetical protein